MPATRLSDSADSTEYDDRPGGVSGKPGQAFADLLVLGALACQTPVALLSVPQPGGGWSTLSHGFDQRHGLNDAQFFEAFAACPGPVEFTDLLTSLPQNPLVQPPHSMRWAYGVALRDGRGTVVGVVAVMDRWLRQLTRREQRAMGALARQTVGHLSSLRRSTDVDEARPILRQVPRNGANGSTQPLKAASPASVEAPHLLRSHEVATIFDVTERTVINWAAAGKLPSLRTIGGHLRFRRDDVMRLVSGADELR
jgi:excisionase family DNA binding protein